MGNPDPEPFSTLLGKLPLGTSRFVAMSRSGGTGETLMQTIAVLSALEGARLKGITDKLMLGLSEPARQGKRNGLRDLLDPRSRNTI